ncbi:DEAD/DEAH box helicase family protein [Clostridium botulinum]|uniref:DEAD/DEAH box helicase family protein n=1 Tax=Clostridium botulinum TaxID=1491 RepID=UPI00069BBD60|nr:DEAD/DEAH box helicase family protein [Clostridium botulinum]KOA75025.1 DNA helicase [Clostridium botulinum]KOC32125.1 DNA helicase [Clostridium botulinum]MCD3276206.1 DEAD/DEAH box helicase family protein [Clostridium botulinum C/D]MCD3287765.1 DEAD/DEAH box helicase family protein [Clostridium botulinum C/D]MCD3290276.1 DEAD/DEAH box helicase family protein [Clostridium botulinum C/D]
MGITSEEMKETILNKEIQSKSIEVKSNNCITGYDDYLYIRLKNSIEKATSIDIIVAFLMESGVRLLENNLKKVLDKNIPIRILTGNYLNITQPSALYLLKDILGDKVDLRFYKEKNRSFHPKAYIFEYDNGGEIFIGSSNISRSALTSGIEWNYRIDKNKNQEDFKYYKDVFEKLFLNESIIINDDELKKYSNEWKRPKIYTEIDNKEEKKVITYPQPRGAQVEALYELRKSREEGFNKALVVAATGIGKTYLAAFDSQKFERILFVAHREEILNQAERSFKSIRVEAKTGFFMGSTRDIDKNIVFATVQTLGKKDNLQKYFKKDYFDYIIIDEFHHAAAGNYKNIINYFKPKFLLGLTATPDRLDNKDVYALCDYNVVYEVGLKDAINKGWLVPFRYYGIYDENINYESIDYKNGKYDEKQLEDALSINKRAEVILNNYKKYKSTRAVGFCTSKRHAQFMADYFNNLGVRACAVYSGKEGIDRKDAISMLAKGEVNVLFSVDMFNEGLDVPSIDMVMFLRPTESPTIFLQQLGRGLRKYQDKKYLNVLDFIGNYKKANLVPFFLTGDRKTIINKANKRNIPGEEDYPQDCLVDFQWQLVDIFKKMYEENKKIKECVIEEFYRIKEYLNRTPTRVDMFTYMDEEIYENIKRNKKNNIFKNYLRFLHELNELTEDEKNLLNTIAEEFIKMLEETSMSKTYKIPVILAFYNYGDFKIKINDIDIYTSFKEFYDIGSNGIDLLRHKATENYKNWGQKEYVKLAKDNPIKFLLKSSSEFFYKEKNQFCINDNIYEFKNNKEFLRHVKDVVDFRKMEFYKKRLEC